MLTTGGKGKANLVLTVEQGKLDWLNSHIPLQLMGQVKINDLIIDILNKLQDARQDRERGLLFVSSAG